MDVIIRHARVPGEAQSRDIQIQGGLISRIAPKIEGKGESEIDAKGALVCPGFIDAHLHLDKALLSDRYTHKKGARTANIDNDFISFAIGTENELKRNFTVKDVRERAKKVVEMAVAAGTTTIGAMVDIDSSAGLTGLKGVVEAKKECKDMVDIQVIAFPQHGIVSSPGVEGMLRDALGSGAEVIGGLPDVDPRPEEQIDIIFDLAKRFHVNINSHIDQTNSPSLFSLPYMAKKTMDEGYQGKVTVAHVYNLSAVPIDDAKRALKMVKEAQMSICFHPSRMLVPGSSELLLNSGVNLALISDNIRDVWYAIGNGDMLLNALLLVFSGYGFSITAKNWLEIFGMITDNAARATWKHEGYGLKVGKQADLVILDANSPDEAVTSQRRRRYVLKKGKIVARDGNLLTDSYE